jgi:hypothetical protein
VKEIGGRIRLFDVATGLEVKEIASALMMVLI